MKIIGIIPARYNSTRLLNKPLMKINNRPLIELTYNAVCQSGLFDIIYIATDSKKIQNIASEFSPNCILTSKHNRNGTERCAELITKLNNKIDKNDIIVNIQCDEPFLEKLHFQKIIKLFDFNTQIGTLISPIHKKELLDSSIVKVKNDKNLHVLDFSRENHLNQKSVYKHVGIYAYRKKTLLELAKLPLGKREKSESLEQLRWLEYGYHIRCDFIKKNLISINTEEDIKKVIENNR